MLKQLAFAVVLFGAVSCGNNPELSSSGLKQEPAERTLTDFSGTWKARGPVTAGGTTVEKEIILKITYNPSYQEWSFRATADGGSMGAYITSGIVEDGPQVSVQCYNPDRNIEIGRISVDTLNVSSEYEVGCRKVASSFRATLREDGKMGVSMNLSKNRAPFSTVTTILVKQ